VSDIDVSKTCEVYPLENSRLWWGVLDTTLCDKVCQWLATGRWFSLGTLVSSTNKTDRHDITDILLKVALNAITPPLENSKFYRRNKITLYIDLMSPGPSRKIICFYPTHLLKCILSGIHKNLFDYFSKCHDIYKFH